MIITGLVLVSCCTGVGWFRTNGRPEITALARAVTASAVLGGPLMVLANYVLLGSVFALPPRYGLALLPLIAICTASAVRVRHRPGVAGNLCAGRFRGHPGHHPDHGPNVITSVETKPRVNASGLA